MSRRPNLPRCRSPKLPSWSRRANCRRSNSGTRSARGDSLMRIKADGRWFHRRRRDQAPGDGPRLRQPAAPRCRRASTGWSPRTNSSRSRSRTRPSSPSMCAQHGWRPGLPAQHRRDRDRRARSPADRARRSAKRRRYISRSATAPKRGLNRSTWLQLVELARATDLAVASQGARFSLVPHEPGCRPAVRSFTPTGHARASSCATMTGDCRSTDLRPAAVLVAITEREQPGISADPPPVEHALAPRAGRLPRRQDRSRRNPDRGRAARGAGGTGDPPADGHA